MDGQWNHLLLFLVIVVNFCCGQNIKQEVRNSSKNYSQTIPLMQDSQKPTKFKQKLVWTCRISNKNGLKRNNSTFFLQSFDHQIHGDTVESHARIHISENNNPEQPGSNPGFPPEPEIPPNPVYLVPHPGSSYGNPFGHPPRISSYWTNPGAGHSAGNTGSGFCRETRDDLREARDHLYHVKETLLERIDCGGNSNCTAIVITSTGPSLLRHPPR